MASTPKTQCKGKPLPKKPSIHKVTAQTNQDRSTKPLNDQCSINVQAAKPFFFFLLFFKIFIATERFMSGNEDGNDEMALQMPTCSSSQAWRCLFEKCENWAIEELAPALCYFWWRSFVFLQSWNTEVMQNACVLLETTVQLWLKIEHIFLSKYKQTFGKC